MERFIIGTAENIEAEYGAVSPSGGSFVIVSLYDGEVQVVEDFNSLEAAKNSLNEIEDRSIIEWML